MNSLALHSVPCGKTACNEEGAVGSHGRTTSRLTVAIRVIHILCGLCVSVVTKVATWVQLRYAGYSLAIPPTLHNYASYATLIGPMAR